jgi:hypothetical protein
MKKQNKPLKFTENTELNIGDYFRAYKSKYYTLVKDIAYDQRDYEDGYGEYYITMVKVDIYDKEEKILAENSIVPIDKLISGALAKYIPDLDYDPTYLGNVDPFIHYAEHKIWKDMTRRCYDCKDTIFPYIGGVGTLLCDRWKCFEYFFADLRHMQGYSEAKDLIRANHHYIVDLYDIQKHIHPFNRIYAPGYVKLKPFKESDICKYYNLPINLNTYPKDLVTTTKYINGEINIKETLFKRQTGMNVKLNLDTANYYYNSNIGYQPLVAMVNPYMTYTYYNYYQQPLKEMCTIVREG